MYMYYIQMLHYRHYIRNDKGRLENAPYVDLSYKWAGGGLISNVKDLCKFGNAMLYSYQAEDSASCDVNNNNANDSNGSLLSKTKSPFLKSETMKLLWTKVDKTVVKWDGVSDGGYGLGWAVWPAYERHAFCKKRPCFVSHTGGAIGASSVLLVLPGLQNNYSDVDSTRKFDSAPKGVVVSIIVNLTSVGLNKTALDIAQLFEE